MNDVFNELIDNICKRTNIKEFKYFKEFERLWRKKFEIASKENILFISEETDDSQMFCYEGVLYGVKVKFDFNIDYLNANFEKCLNLNLIKKTNLQNSNGYLHYYSNPCSYTRYSCEDVNYNYPDMDKIYMVALPIVPQEFVIIDGNHRLCKQIYDNKTEIDVYYIFDNYALMSLMKPIQICLYAFLFDSSRIVYNLGKIKDGIIRNRLYIYNHNSTFFIAFNR